LNVFVVLSPCKELTFKHWTFWRSNSLFLLPQTISIAAELNLNLNSRIYYLDSNFSFFEIYKYQPNDSTFNIRKIADAITPDIPNKLNSIWDRRSNLRTIHLNINYMNNPPYIEKKNGSQRVSGFLGEIFYAIQENLGFQYTLNDPETTVWGYLQENGTYNGLLGQIQTGKINWSISDMTLTLKRSLTFDFSFPIMNQPKKLVTRRRSENFDTRAYFLVFSNHFWIVLIFSIIVVIFCIYFMLKFDSVDDMYQSNRLAAAFSFTMLSLLCKESYVLNASWSGKILILSVLFWGFLISVSYNAILTSVLALSWTSPAITSLEELLHSPDYTLVLRPSGIVRDFFQGAANNTIGKIIYSQGTAASRQGTIK
jgi:hypothetical protein